MNTVPRRAGAGAEALRAAYAAAAAGFVGYAVWGSLFPFDFHAVPLADAAALFWTRWAHDAGSWSLTDLVSNVVLFLPIGLLLCAALDRSTQVGDCRTPSAGLTAAATLLFAAALSGAIEFAQAFVSWRTPSIVDVAAEIAGAACGIAIWWSMSGELDRALGSAVDLVRRSTWVEQVLLACCAAFAIAWLLPADFTLRPGEIADKYEHKRLLLPWMPSPDAATGGQLAAIAVAAIPIGLAAAICGGRSGGRRSVASAALIAGAGLAALEFMQMPIFSRTTDANELLAALAGSTFGAASAALTPRPVMSGVDWRAVQLTAAVVLLVSVVLALEWWPFRMALDASRLQVETILWSRQPFRWPAGAGDVIPGAMLAAFAGAFARPRLDPRFERLQAMALIGFAGGVFTICEVGRIVLADGRPTLLSVVFKLSAFAGGLYLGPTLAGGRLRAREAD